MGHKFGLAVPVLVAFALMLSLSAQASAQTCIGQEVVKSLIISNTGTEGDTFTITSSNPGWVSVDDSVFIESGQSVTVDVRITPQIVGANTYQLLIAGSREDPKTITDSETGIECRDVTIVGAPSEVTACEGIEASFDIIIKNGGQITDTYDVSTSAGSLEKPRVTIEPDESETMKLTVDTEGIEDEIEIFISAASGDVVDTHSMTLIVRNCYSAQMTISPEEIVQCPSDSVSYQIYLKNTGELADEYLLTIMDDITQTFRLQSEETRLFDFSLPLEKGAGSMDIAVKVESEHVMLTDSARLTVKPAEECFSVELEEPVVNIEQCSASTVPIKLRNTGDEAQTFRLDIEGPEWVYLNSDMELVEPGEEAEAYVYISPLYETPTGSYTVTINSDSERSVSELELVINVMPNATDYVPPSQPETPPEQPPEDGGDVGNDTGAENVSLNASIGDDVTGGAISLGIAPLWKTVVVAFITLIIVVILVVRFAILVKQ